MDFGDRLSEVRRERGLTQTLLAERAGISASMVHRYESGAAQPTLDVVRRLAVALSISADTLIFADSPRTIVEDRLRSAMEMTVHLSEHEQAVIAEVIENFVAARVARERPDRTRGPLPKRRRQPG